MTEKRKVKNDHRRLRRILPYILVAAIGLTLGIVGTLILRPPKMIPYARNGIIVEGTAEHFDALYVIEDIPCGTQIRLGQVVQAITEQPIAYSYGRIARDFDAVFGSIATRDLRRGAVITEGSIAPQTETVVCPTPS